MLFKVLSLQYNKQSLVRGNGFSDSTVCHQKMVLEELYSFRIFVPIEEADLRFHLENLISLWLDDVIQEPAFRVEVGIRL